MGSVAGEKIRFFHGGIAAANDGDGLAAKKEAVARSAGGNAAAQQGPLFGEAEQARGSSRGDDKRLCLITLGAGGDHEGAFGKIHVGDDAGIEFRAESLRLFAHVFDQLVTHNAVGKAGEILDHGGERELPAGLVAVNHQRLQIGARGVNRGG